MTGVLKLGLALLMAGSMWYYFEAILIPYQQKTPAAIHTQGLSDLYPRWLGARELLLHGRDPYSAEVTREIQTGIYGRALDGSLARDEHRFAYPVYVVLLVAPAALIPFPIAETIFRILLAALTVVSVPLWMQALGLRVQRTTTVAITVLLLGSLPVVQGLNLVQLTLLVCFLAAGSCMAVARGHLATAGALLAIATIKPQLVVGLAAWLGLWALGDWALRKRLVLGFASSMAMLCIGAECILPGWFGRWWASLHAYLAYVSGRSLPETLLGRTVGLLLCAVVVLGLVVLCWRSRRAPAGSHAFSTCLVSVFAASLLLNPKFLFYDVVMLLPAALWIFGCRKTLWKRSRAGRDLFFGGAVLLGWQWFSAAALVAVSLVSPAAAQRGWGLPIAALLLMPVASVSLLGLLAVEFWKHGAFSQPVAPVPELWPGVTSRA